MLHRQRVGQSIDTFSHSPQSQHRRRGIKTCTDVRSERTRALHEWGLWRQEVALSQPWKSHKNEACLVAQRELEKSERQGLGGTNPGEKTIHKISEGSLFLLQAWPLDLIRAVANRVWFHGHNSHTNLGWSAWERCIDGWFSNFAVFFTWNCLSPFSFSPLVSRIGISTLFKTFSITSLKPKLGMNYGKVVL